MSGAGLGITAFRSYARRAALRRVDNKQVVPIKTWHIVRGDTVMVLTGRDRGKSGKVKEVLRNKNRLVITGVNVRRRIFRSGVGSSQLKAVESPIAYSNVNLVDPATSKPTRIAIRFTETGDKVRVAKRSGTVIPWPEEMKLNRSLKPATPGLKDTAVEAVSRVSYVPPAALVPYLQRGSGKIWTLGQKQKGVPSEEPQPWVVRNVRLNRKDRNRILSKWRRRKERVQLISMVAALLEKDTVLTDAVAAASNGGSSSGRGGGSGAGQAGTAAAAAASAFVFLSALSTANPVEAWEEEGGHELQSRNHVLGGSVSLSGHTSVQLARLNGQLRTQEPEMR